MKVWLRIKATSDRVAEETARNGRSLVPGERCGEGHLRQVLARLGADFPDDHNLPRRFETLEEYFGRFCDDCVHIPTKALSWIGADTGFLPNLDICLAALAERELPLAEALAAKFGVPLVNVAFLNASAYRAARGITRGEFERRVESALPLMLRCMENAINARPELTFDRDGEDS